jgi:AraC-like DNA-binding protein
MPTPISVIRSWAFFTPKPGTWSTWAASPPRQPKTNKRKRSEFGCLTELAKDLHLTSGHLVLLFKDATGLPPMAYLAHVHAEHAGVLLLHSDEPITSIGRGVGWPDQNYFTRRFKAHHGLSATTYRKRFATGAPILITAIRVTRAPTRGRFPQPVGILVAAIRAFAAPGGNVEPADTRCTRGPTGSLGRWSNPSRRLERSYSAVVGDLLEAKADLAGYGAHGHSGA